MAKAFSMASWNVEHFKGDPARVKRVVQFLKDQNPDVFALYEVEGKTVFGDLTRMMPRYTFHVTEGPQTQEILVGLKSSFTGFFTQKLEFKKGNQYLRPGALLTVVAGGATYPILFLHTKSSALPEGLGLRDSMFERAFKFKSTLDKQAGGNGKSNFIFLGDLNTMGMKYPFKLDIPAGKEIEKIDKDAKKKKMRRLGKNAAATWWNGSGRLKPSDLDHVVASDQVKFKAIKGSPIDVRGWPNQTTDAARQKWIKEYSDHALLYMEVQK